MNKLKLTTAFLTLFSCNAVMAAEPVALRNPVCEKVILEQIEKTFAAADGPVSIAIEKNPYSQVNGHTEVNGPVTTADVAVYWKNSTYNFAFELRNAGDGTNQTIYQLKGAGTCEIIKFELKSSY